MVAGFPAAQPAKVARRAKGPRLLTPDMVHVAERSFRAGMTQFNVASILGVSLRTMNKWIAEADEDGCTNDLLLEFADACRRGRASALQTLTEHAMMHSADDGRVTIKLLEVLNPDFNVTKNVKVDATLAPAQLLDLSTLTDEEFEVVQRADQIREQAAARAKALPA